MKTQIHRQIHWPFTAIIAAGLALSPLASVRAEHDGSRGKFTESDFKFVHTAATGGKMEVELGRIAAQKATLPAVKKFGEQMIADHGKASAKLKEMAATEGAVLPEKLTAEQQKEVDRISRLSGREFDKAYVSLMVDDHKKALKAFQDAAKKSDNAKLQEFAAETVPTIEHHLATAKSLDEQLSGKRDLPSE